MISKGVSIDAVTISPNPVAVNATFLISVAVSLITVETKHSNLDDFTHSKLSVYTHKDLCAEPSVVGTHSNLGNFKHSEINEYTNEEIND